MERQTEQPTAVTQVRDGLLRGALSPADLSARRLGALFGKTTSVFYHHYGSLDGFLFAVAQSGMCLLGERLGAALAAGADLGEIAAGFVAFGLEAPALYGLMFERRFDWAALRRAGALSDDLPGLRMFSLLCDHLRAAGAADPRGDARMLFAGLHGLVSLALSGRANIGDLDRTDEAAALDAARELARRLCPGAPRRTHVSSDDPRPPAPRPPRRPRQPPRQGGDERAPRGQGRRAP